MEIKRKTLSNEKIESKDKAVTHFKKTIRNSEGKGKGNDGTK